MVTASGMPSVYEIGLLHLEHSRCCLVAASLLGVGLSCMSHMAEHLPLVGGCRSPQFGHAGET